MKKIVRLWQFFTLAVDKWLSRRQSRRIARECWFIDA
jgi:hypothetical protein